MPAAASFRATLFVGAIATIAVAAPTHAQERPQRDAADQATRQDLTPVPVVQQRFNLVGLGLGFIPDFSGSNSYRALPLPVLRLGYKDKLFINVLQAGAWLYSSEDNTLKVGVAIEPRFGWSADDNARVAGMENRSFSFEGGPNVQWRTPLGVLTANFYQDLGGASDGQTAQITYVKALWRTQQLFVNGSAGAQWFSGGMNDYYFGVRPFEATGLRPQYTGRSSVSLQLGLNGAWRVSERGSVLFGIGVSRIGAGAADSPIVETRIQSVFYGGYGWSF
jgi:outer membrane protein